MKIKSAFHKMLKTIGHEPMACLYKLVFDHIENQRFSSTLRNFISEAVRIPLLTTHHR